MLKYFLHFPLFIRSDSHLLKMARMVNVLVAVLAVVVALSWPAVSAQTHHVVGGEGGWRLGSDMDSWLSGREFRVGDKIWFSFPATEEGVIEVQSVDEFESCDVTNPIKMYTDAASHVTLDKEGIRYFTSGNPDNCKKGLKLPVNVQQPPWFWPPQPDSPPPPSFEPPQPFYPPYVPSSPPPPPSYWPTSPPPPPSYWPTSPPPPPSYWPSSPPPPPPVSSPPPPPPPVTSPPPPTPPPPHVPSPPPPPPPPFFIPPPPSSPSASVRLNGLSFVLFAMLGLVGYMGI